jgi:pimeloyl-ACP methyl ester carboxylesterase
MKGLTMRRILIPFVCLVMLWSARPAQAGWREWVSPSQNWQRIKNCCRASKQRVQVYCREKVAKAEADQEKLWGLKLPADYDPNKPLVVLIHGLDSQSGVWWSMAQLLQAQRYQVAYFSFPSDGPVRDDGNRLADEMQALHETFPQARVDLIAHSMGGLIARAYIEGNRYTQPVDRFIAVGPPNHGSPWTRERFVLEANEQYWLWRTNKDWSPIWMFTDGHGEAADDLKPDSKFLKTLNARPRRAGVKYTIICGDQHVFSRFGASALNCMVNSLPRRNVWGVRLCKFGLAGAEMKLETQKGDSDGVVPLDSAKLPGVADIVRLHGDHNTLVMASGGKPPVAWETIRERLAD